MILQEHRADVVTRIEALTACLALVDFKIANYERIEAGLVPLAPSHDTTQEEVPA